MTDSNANTSNGDNPLADDETLPSDSVYEDGIKVKEELRSKVELNGTVWEGIDWDQDIDTAPEIQEATAVAASQFHYANTAHLILCGKILKYELADTVIDTQKLAVSLSSFKIEDADIWGRYIATLGDAQAVDDTTKAYYRQLFSETDLLPLLIGMETLGGPVAYTVYGALTDTGDPLFQQINQNMVDQKEKEIEIAVDHLQPAIARLEPAEQETLAAAGQDYCGRITAIYGSYANTFTTFGVNIPELRQNTMHQIQEFYQQIGLPAPQEGQ